MEPLHTEIITIQQFVYLTIYSNMFTFLMTKNLLPRITNSVKEFVSIYHVNDFMILKQFNELRKMYSISIRNKIDYFFNGLIIRMLIRH